MRYQDALPPHPPSLQSSDEEDVVFGDSEGIFLSTPPASESSAHRTSPNSYGIYRVYPGGKVTYSPDEIYSLDSVADGPLATVNDLEEDSHPWWSAALSSDDNKDYYDPFPTASHFRLMQWFYGGSTSKSLAALDDLVQNVLLATDFKSEDLVGFHASREAQRLDQSHNIQSRFSADDGWIEHRIEIFLPAEGVKHASERHAPKFEVSGLIHRRLLHVIKAALHETSTKHFHLFPYQELWEPSFDSPPERIYSELYNSDAFLAEHDKIRAHCNGQDSGPQTENIIIAIMLWSDSTHLTSFGSASLWPIYLFVGNLSKYIRSKPTTRSAHHVAYIPKVSYLYLL